MGKWNKYRAKKTNCAQGHTHGSKKEAMRCNQLSEMEQCGQISDLQQQPQFWFAINGKPLKHANGHRVGYKSDFQYRDDQGRLVVEEVKGFTVRDWPLRRAVFVALYPDIIFREV
jgi:hypothetical protein